MKFSPYLPIILIGLSSLASATSLRPADGVDLHGWQIEFSSPTFTAVRNDQTMVGERQNQAGDFSTWVFHIVKSVLLNQALSGQTATPPSNSNDGLEVILNEKTGVIFDIQGLYMAGGPFLSVASADSSMVALDFGTGTGDRSFQVWDATGHKLFGDPYLGDLVWEKNTLVYSFPAERLDLNLNEKTRACSSAGVAWKVKQKRFSPQRVETIESRSNIICSN